MSGSKLVYTSENGRICPGCERPVASCTCRPVKRRQPGAEEVRSGPVDGIARVQRETRGRGGKTATVVMGLPVDEAKLAEIAGVLKKRCGCGGTAKDGVIVIQGDHADAIVDALQKQGYKAKRAGG
ncbi:MAG TPA: translation initiation factor Sui1 [Candidatus Ozemobacteraceae bacterium]|nr:translation initiation factor Sui1 [Candidatus Ozemobacteraceae bacterium]HQG29652.1 translation initiation factor Sui1 [Candidatus Ozemobacteraceae bacterium]